MVYCGKASQGCKNCRVRRIKCDRVSPECSQCIRVGKKCPGYRDQLSLMFRDESSKVIQKAHAQWGVGDAPDASQPHPTSFESAAASSSSSPSASSSTSSSSSSSSPSSSSNTPLSTRPFSRTKQIRPPQKQPASAPVKPSIASAAAVVSPHIVWYPKLVKDVDPNIEEQGVQFYVNRYLIGHPDEPRTASELSEAEWLESPVLQDIITAIGLAGLSNLKEDRGLMLTARQRYGQALRQTGQLIKTSATVSVEVTMRAVVLLAMFELVKGTHQSMEHVHVHIMGGVALLRSLCPMPGVPFGGVRSLIQLCYCMFIPAHLAGSPLSALFYEWVSFSRPHLAPEDRPTIDLGLLIARFIDLWAYIRTFVLKDGRSKIKSILQQLVDLDADFAEWHRRLGDIWLYRTHHATHLPPPAVFEGEYHVYYDMWVARMLGHFRWARILVNQTILELMDRCPRSDISATTAKDRDRHLLTVRTLARDVLVSTPSHWRHPLLDDKSPVPVEKPGGAGSGAAGIPVVLYQLKAAACAPGVPAKYWKWAYGVMECIWGDLGMVQARSMMEVMRAHQEHSQAKDTSESCV